MATPIVPRRARGRFYFPIADNLFLISARVDIASSRGEPHQLHLPDLAAGDR